MPLLGWVAIAGLAFLYGRSLRRMAEAGVSEEAGPPATVQEAAGDVGRGVLGTFGAATTALGAPLKESLYQLQRSGVSNGARNTQARS